MAGTGAARADASRPAADQVPWYQRLWFRLLRRGLLFLFVLLLVDLVVLPELAGAHKAWNTLRSANWGYVVAAVVLEGAALVAYAGLTKAVLPPRSATLLTLLRIDLSTLAVSHVVPGGTAAGTPLAYRLLTEEGVSGTDAAFAVSTQGIGSAVVLNVILWVSLIITIPLRGLHTGSEAVYAVAASVGAVLFALFGGLLYFLTRGQRRAAAVLGAIGRRMPLLKEDQLVQAVDRLAKRLGELISDRRLLVRAVGWAAANWLADAACLWVFIAAFDRFINPVALLVCYGLANVLAAIPITPGGLGVVEAALPLSLAGFGVQRGVALLSVVAYRLVNFWLPIPVGALAYVSLRVEPGSSRRARVEELRRLAHLPASGRRGAPGAGLVPPGQPGP